MSLERIKQEEEALEKLMFQSEPSVEEPAQTPEEVSEDPDEKIIEPEILPDATTVTHEETQESEDEDKRVSWKNRFKSFKASADKTIFSLRKENARLAARVRELEQEKDDLSVRIANLTQRDNDVLKDVITAEDTETIGEEAVDIIRRSSKKIAEASVAPLQEEIKKLRAEKLAEQKRQIEQQNIASYNAFLNELSQYVPDYNDINFDPKFKEFMEGYDEMTGDTRMEVFKRAEEYRDASRVADFFLDFKRLTPRSKKDVLMESITPSGTTSGPTGVRGRKVVETYTARQVEDFYNDLARGVYKNRKKDADEIETKITKAYLEGRII